MWEQDPLFDLPQPELPIEPPNEAENPPYDLIPTLESLFTNSDKIVHGWMNRILGVELYGTSE